MFLARNLEDLVVPDKQVRHVAKLLNVRPATSGELETSFPGVDAGRRWNHVVELYWVRELPRPFNLREVPGLNFKRYSPVQGFAKFDHSDQFALLEYLISTNEPLILDFINNAERL